MVRALAALTELPDLVPRTPITWLHEALILPSGH